jgi:hypothetical protein
LHIAFKHVATQEGEGIYNSLSEGSKLDALRHIYAIQSSIVKNPDLFPLEYKILQYVKSKNFNTLPILGASIDVLRKKRSTVNPLHKFGEQILDYYYTASSSPYYYQNLLGMLQSFASNAKERGIPFDSYVAAQAKAAGWEEFDEEWNGSYTDQKIYLHVIQALQRYLHV